MYRQMKTGPRGKFRINVSCWTETGATHEEAYILQNDRRRGAGDRPERRGLCRRRPGQGEGRRRDEGGNRDGVRSLRLYRRRRACRPQRRSVRRNRQGARRQDRMGLAAVGRRAARPRGGQVRHGRRPRDDHQGPHGALSFHAADRRGDDRADEAQGRRFDHEAARTSPARSSAPPRRLSQLQQLIKFGDTLPVKPEVRGEYVGFNEAYADLAAGRIVAVGNSLPNIAFVAKQQPTKFEVVLPHLRHQDLFRLTWAARTRTTRA